MNTNENVEAIIDRNQCELQNLKDDHLLFNKFERDYDNEIDILIEKTKKVLSNNCMGNGFYQFAMLMLLSASWGVGKFYFIFLYSTLCSKSKKFLSYIHSKFFVYIKVLDGIHMLMFSQVFTSNSNV